MSTYTDQKMEDDNIICEINKCGIRYVIRHLKLTETIISRIINGEFTTINDEEDITEYEIRQFQKKFIVTKS